jgi:cytochrome P450
MAEQAESPPYDPAELGSSYESVYQDGVVDVFNHVVALHDGPRVVRDEAGVTFVAMEDVLQITKRRDVHSSDAQLTAMMGGLIGTGRPLIPLMIDGEEHTKYRKLLDPLFAPKEVAKIEARTRALSNDLIDRFIGAGHVDLYGEFCDPLPSRIFLTLLGLPLEDMAFLQWFKDGIIRPTDEEHRNAVSPKMVEYIYAELDRRAARADPGDDLFGGFMKSEVDGHRLSREDVVDIVYLLVMAGLDTVAASLSCMVEWLARNPRLRQALIDDPSRWPAAIEELLRIQTPVVAGTRFATADFEIGGERVKAGDTLRVHWAAANLDDALFDHPSEVDFARDSNRHIAFASGFHRCLGSHLARMELRVALETLHSRIPDYTLDPAHSAGINNIGIRNVDPLPLVFTPGPETARAGA